jgi:hypothetical protein
LVRILAGLTRTVLPFGFELAPGRRIGDQPITVLAREPHRFLAVGGCQYWNRVGWRIGHFGINIEVFALMCKPLSGPKPTNNRNGFDQPIPTLLPLRPLSGRGLFIEGLARAQTEKHAARIKLRQSRERLGDHRRLVA